MTNSIQASIPKDSVGLVSPQIHHFAESITLESGIRLTEFDLIYETYGELNQAKSNAILVCHALSGDHHVAGYHSPDDKKPGWWDAYIGPGKPFDTNKFFFVCCNNLGGCKGSSGPMSINPATNKPYGRDFPIVTVKDWVYSQSLLADALNIEKFVAVLGGSLGGMQALQWAIDFPNRLEHAIVIAAAPKLSAQNIGFNEVARQAISSDPEFYDGHYYEHNVIPRRGLKLARMLGHITYLSDESMRAKFGRELREGKINFNFDTEFQVESYLRYQGESFVDMFDANTYLLMTKALDYFDPAKDYNDDLAAALKNATARFLVVAFTSDWRFAPERSREIVKALLDSNKQATYSEITANQGHDAFLIPNKDYQDVLYSYMKHVEASIK
ncbi:homoserine O-acetyltransferase [Beggiatoa alba]|nr:homoserine O-acetyltransferase [Beggiatoa alba]